MGAYRSHTEIQLRVDGKLVGRIHPKDHIDKIREMAQRFVLGGESGHLREAILFDLRKYQIVERFFTDRR